MGNAGAEQLIRVDKADVRGTQAIAASALGRDVWRLTEGTDTLASLVSAVTLRGCWTRF